MIRHLLAGAAGIAVISALSVAPAEAAAFKATLTSSTAKADIDKTFRLSGKVTGAGSASKKIIVQRKVLTDKKPVWKDFSTITTRPTGTYAKEFKVLSVGAKSYRVLVPKTSKLTTGKSNTKTVTGYTWLDLYDESYLTQGTVQRGWTGKLNGETPPRHSIALNPGGFVGWRPTSLCDSTTFELAAPGESGPDQDVKVRTSNETIVQVNAGTPYSLKRSLEGSAFLSLKNQSSDYVVMMSPLAHCSVTRLPIAYD